MKLKTPLIRSVVIISILILSVIIGLIISAVCNRIDLKKYPRPDNYKDYVSKYAEEYAVPEYIIYAVIKNESNFDKGREGENGKIGLMGITVKEFESMLRITGESLSKDALYGPETNIKYGAMKLSLLYNRFEKWSFVTAAYVSGDKYELWLSDKDNFDEEGNFIKVPDSEIADKGEDLFSIAEKYEEMYYGE
ncbi:MAG: transglycosylase SLT domain-containing protein [Clostridia bacterium]|nr:transglycosylase SLT domain-containing protein [Clostridia bacterium]